MPKAKAGLAVQTAPTKTLVRGSDGKLFVLDQSAATPTLTAVDPLAKPDPTVQAILDTANAALTEHFNSLGLANLASGVKITLTQVY